MEIDKKSVGRRIQSLRKNKGMTLEEFGNLFGASRGNVSLWESGRSLPNNERLKAIAKIGDISVNELIYGEFKSYVYSLFDRHLNSILKEFELKNFSDSDKPEVYDRAYDNLVAKMPNVDYDDIDYFLIKHVLGVPLLANEVITRRSNYYALDSIIDVIRSMINEGIPELFFEDYSKREGLFEDMDEELYSKINDLFIELFNNLQELQDDYVDDNYKLDI